MKCFAARVRQIKLNTTKPIGLMAGSQRCRDWNDPDHFVTSRQAGCYSVTLARLRSDGSGPAYCIHCVPLGIYAGKNSNPSTENFTLVRRNRRAKTVQYTRWRWPPEFTAQGIRRMVPPFPCTRQITVSFEKAALVLADRHRPRRPQQCLIKLGKHHRRLCVGPPPRPTWCGNNQSPSER